jgi:hypothetical protein
MFPLQETELSIAQIADYWSREIKASATEIQTDIEKGLWRGEILRFRRRRRDWLHSVEWYLLWPPGDPASWSDHDLESIYATIAKYWGAPPAEIVCAVNENPIHDVVLTRTEFFQWISARGYALPTFWGPWTSEDGDARSSGIAASPALPELTTSDALAPPRGSAISEIRRGPRPWKRTDVMDRMRVALESGKLTRKQLQEMPEKTMEAEYGVSRDTARKARNEVLGKP